MRNPTRVFLVDDHPVVRAGLRELLKHSRTIAVIGEASDGSAETRARVKDAQPDVAIVDIRLGHESGIDLCRELKRSAAGIRVILLSAYWDDALVRRALDAGADGYLLKDAEQLDLAKSVLAVTRGEPFFDREISAAIIRQMRGQNVATYEVSEDDAKLLRLVANGLTNKAIADELYLSHHTVRDRLSAVMRALGAKNRAEAVQVASKAGLI